MRGGFLRRWGLGGGGLGRGSVEGRGWGGKLVMGEGRGGEGRGGEGWVVIEVDTEGVVRWEERGTFW